MLSSALAERGVPMRSLEEAIARQVVHGGDLVTNLLEVGGFREEMLVPLLAEVMGLEEAPSGKLPQPLAQVLRLVPGDLAIRHGIFPLALTRRVLTIATAEPLSPAVEGDLAFALAVEIRQSVAPLVRIRQAIEEAYQIPLDRRFLRLVAKLESRPDPSPTVAPPPRSLEQARASSRPPPERAPEPPVATPHPPTQTPDTLVAGAAPPLAPTRTKLSATPAASRAARADLPRARPTVEVVAPKPAPAPANAVASPRRPLTSDEMPETIAAPPVDAPLADVAEEDAPVSRRPDRPLRRESNRAHTKASVLRRAVTGDRKTRAEGGADRRPARPRRKGPFTAAMAEEELGEATTTDAVLDIFFAFAHQFFEYTALFAVHGDVADGRDASGPGAGAARLMSLAVPLGRPSLLALARERRAPVIMPPAVGDLDVEIIAELGRATRAEAGTRAPAVLVLPIVVKNRTVALLYGDDGAVDVELSAIGDVIAIAGLTAEALERAILRKKRGGAPGDGAPAKRPPRIAPQPQAQGAARKVGLVALARALELPARSTNAAEPPAPEPKSPPPTTAAISTIAVTLPSASAMAPAMLQASPQARPADETSFAGIASSQPRPAPQPVPEPPRTPSATPPAAPQTTPQPTRATLDETLTSPTPAPGPVTSRPEPLALRPPESDSTWEITGRSRTAPPSRRRRTPLGVVATGRVRLTPPTPAPPPITAVSQPPEAGRAPLPAPPPRVARRAIAPSFGGRSKASQGLGAQPLPPEPPPNAIAAPPTPPVPPVRPVVPTAPAVPAPPVRVPPPGGDTYTPGPPETLPGPPVEAWGLRPAAAAPAPAVAEWSAAPAGSTTPGRPRPAGPDPITLVQRFLETGADDGDAFKELVRLGEAAMHAIMARFPGPLRLDPRVLSRGAELPLASRSGPLLGLIHAMGRSAVPFLAVRSTAGDPDVRFWATHLLGELVYPESAQAVFTRIFDDAAPVRRVARRAAAALVAAGPATEAPILPTLERLARNAGERVGRRQLAIEALGELASPKVVPVLITMLSETSSELVEAAHRALVIVTRHDFRRDAGKWNDWWSNNGARGRVEWLIDALLSESPTLRRAAAEELAPLVGRDLGYYDDLPEDEREAAQVRYVLWWEQEGRHKKRG
ncbi:HEAT repeat domain-containing protein [Polyangium spumosum]|uniref:Type II secretion system protein GspE N-terminal domain-containing protein n=1 Tax=Polyangium spumosum TaxID=889282 RepID=A0A6N7PIF6_9BACT|nr:HEAT repeat domain-containing protein [Polyangium spumosum]MRG91597.1 hypothetical protein [Polyangium spumosum]